jgi:prophage regulatory protein
MNEVPKLMRLKEVLELIPVSKSTWWAGMKSGRYPKPIYLGPRTPAWRLTDIIELTEHGMG